MAQCSGAGIVVGTEYAESISSSCNFKGNYSKLHTYNIDSAATYSLVVTLPATNVTARIFAPGIGAPILVYTGSGRWSFPFEATATGEYQFEFISSIPDVSYNIMLANGTYVIQTSTDQPTSLSTRKCVPTSQLGKTRPFDDRKRTR